MSVVPPSWHSQPPAGGGGHEARHLRERPVPVLEVHVPRVARPRAGRPRRASPPETAVQLVVALGTLAHGRRTLHAVLRGRIARPQPAARVRCRAGRTPSRPGVQGRVCTQFCTGSQSSPLGQLASSGVWTHLLVCASHESSVHGTPSSQFIGLPVGMQKPPMHWKPPVAAHRSGEVQSVLCTHVAASGGGVGPPASTLPASVPPPELELVPSVLARLPSPSTTSPPARAPVHDHAKRTDQQRSDASSLDPTLPPAPGQQAWNPTLWL